jgi:hypothetical protein
MLVQINDKAVDASWSLDHSKTSIEIEGEGQIAFSASRHDYITAQGGFAYSFDPVGYCYREGRYKVNLIVTRDDEERRYKGEYQLTYRFVSILDYLIAIYQQRKGS